MQKQPLTLTTHNLNKHKTIQNKPIKTTTQNIIKYNKLLKETTRDINNSKEKTVRINKTKPKQIQKTINIINERP